MNDEVSHARQWLRKAESDLTAVSDLTAFAVESRYDNEFWPERAEAADAVANAAQVHTVAATIIEAPKPGPPQS